MRYTAAYNTIKLANKFENKLIKQSGAMDYVHLILDVLGLIPGIGEFFDAANALSYAVEGKWLYATLSIISMVPEIGDAAAKGGKLALWIGQKSPKALEAIVKHGPKIKAAIVASKNLFEENKDNIVDFLKKLKEEDEEDSEPSMIIQKIEDKLGMSRNEIIDKLIDELDNIKEVLDNSSRLTSNLK